MEETPGRDRLVAVIGVFKLVKASILAPIGVAALRGVPETIVRSAVHGMGWTGALSGHHAVRAAFARLASMNDHTIRELGLACLAYAVVFVVEGTGLLLRRRWAEWLTVGVTGSLIPFEIYELARRPGTGKLIALVLNAAIVASLAWRRVRAHAAAPPSGSRFRSV
jgi:hypothetical protein